MKVDFRADTNTLEVNPLRVNTGGSDFHSTFQDAYEDINNNQKIFQSMMSSFKDLTRIFYERTNNVGTVRGEAGQSFHTVKQFFPDTEGKYGIINDLPTGTFYLRKNNWNKPWQDPSVTGVCQYPFVHTINTFSCTDTHIQATIDSKILNGFLDYYDQTLDVNDDGLLNPVSSGSGNVARNINQDWCAWKDVSYGDIYYVGVDDDTKYGMKTTTGVTQWITNYLAGSNSNLDCNTTQINGINSLDNARNFLTDCNNKTDPFKFKEIMGGNLALYNISDKVTSTGSTWERVPNTILKHSCLTSYNGKETLVVPNVAMFDFYQEYDTPNNVKIYYAFEIADSDKFTKDDFVDGTFAGDAIKLYMRKKTITDKDESKSTCAGLMLKTGVEQVRPSATLFAAVAVPSVINVPDDDTHLKLQPTDTQNPKWCDVKLNAERAAKYLKALSFIMDDFAYSMRRDIMLLHLYTNGIPVTWDGTNKLITPTTPADTNKPNEPLDQSKYIVVPGTGTGIININFVIFNDNMTQDEKNRISTFGQIFTAKFTLVQNTTDNRKTYAENLPSDGVTEKNYKKAWTDLSVASSKLIKEQDTLAKILKMNDDFSVLGTANYHRMIIYTLVLLFILVSLYYVSK